MTQPSHNQVAAGVQRAVASVLTVTDEGIATVPVCDLESAIEAGVALAFAGLIVCEEGGWPPHPISRPFRAA